MVVPDPDAVPEPTDDPEDRTREDATDAPVTATDDVVQDAANPSPNTSAESESLLTQQLLIPRTANRQTASKALAKVLRAVSDKDEQAGRS